jgi:hypothetical protein
MNLQDDALHMQPGERFAKPDKIWLAGFLGNRYPARSGVQAAPSLRTIHNRNEIGVQQNRRLPTIPAVINAEGIAQSKE